MAAPLLFGLSNWMLRIMPRTMGGAALSQQQQQRSQHMLRTAVLCALMALGSLIISELLLIRSSQAPLAKP
jgi:hypothetical protein